MGVTTEYTGQPDVQLFTTTANSRPQRSAKPKWPIVIDDDTEEEESYGPVKKRARKQSKKSVASNDDPIAPLAPAGNAKADRLAAARARVLAELHGYQNETKKASSKQSATKAASKAKLVNGDEHVELEDHDALPVKATKGKAKTKAADPTEEKRAKRFREKAPQSFAELFDRATTQRMFVLDRKQTASSAAPPTASTAAPLTYAAAPTPAAAPISAPSAKVHLAGTTGNIYVVHITHVPTCSCPAYTKAKSPCKHIIYVLHHVLKAPANLVYQLAFLTSELVQIFAHAPPPPGAGGVDANTAGNRKPVEDDCPICCCEFEPSEPASSTVFCRAACGNNMHTTCFSQWAASKRATGSVVTCPFCRTPWQAGEQDISAAAKDAMGAVGAGTAQKNSDGYVNIAGALGISGKRDYSSVSDDNVAKIVTSE